MRITPNTAERLSEIADFLSSGDAYERTESANRISTYLLERELDWAGVFYLIARSLQNLSIEEIYTKCRRARKFLSWSDRRFIDGIVLSERTVITAKECLRLHKVARKIEEKQHRGEVDPALQGDAILANCLDCEVAETTNAQP